TLAAGGGSLIVGNGNAGTLASSGTNNRVFADVDFGAQEGVVHVNAGGTLELAGVLSGTNANSLNKAGLGDLRLSGNNAYTGTANVLEGSVTASNANSFGTTAAGTVVQQQAQIRLDNVAVGNEALTLNAFLDSSPT